MPIKKSLAVIGMILFCAVTLCGCMPSNTTDENGDNRILVIGIDEYEPYVFYDDSGDYTGIDIEIAEEACRRIGYRAEFKMIDWEETKRYLENGNVDCIWRGLFIDGREDNYQWTVPYLTSEQCVAVRTDSDLYTLNDLNNKNVAVQASSKAEKILLEHTEPNIPIVKNVYSFDETEDELAALRKGYVDACAGHKRRLKAYTKTAPDMYRMLEQNLTVSNIGVAFSKKFDTSFVKNLSEVLFEMKIDGTIAEILNKYD